MKNLFCILLSGFIFSCSQSKEIISKYNNSTISKVDTTENNQVNNKMLDNKKIDLTLIPEMENIPDFKNFVQNDLISISKEKVQTDISIYKDQIKALDLVSISKWAKKEMMNYKVQDSTFENMKIEKNYIYNSQNFIKIKLDSLPSHSPLVKRFLYLFTQYDNNNNLKDIYITIQGYAEE